MIGGQRNRMHEGRCMEHTARVRVKDKEYINPENENKMKWCKFMSWETYRCLSNSGSGSEGGQLGHITSDRYEVLSVAWEKEVCAILACWGGDWERWLIGDSSGSRLCVWWGWRTVLEGEPEQFEINDQKGEKHLHKSNLTKGHLFCRRGRTWNECWTGILIHFLFVARASLAHLSSFMRCKAVDATLLLTDSVL